MLKTGKVLCLLSVLSLIFLWQIYIYNLENIFVKR